MASITLNPPTKNPVSVQSGINTSYTVPSGKFAEVSVQAMIVSTFYNAGTTFGHRVGEKNKSFSNTIRLKAADVLNYSVSGTTDYSLTVTVNGTAIAKISFGVNCSPVVGGTSARDTVNTSDSSFSWEASEYNLIT